MRRALIERFQRDVRSLDTAARAAVFDVLRGLPAAIGEIHRYQGLGLRKLHRSGIWEARVGLGLRLVLTIEWDVCTLLRVGTHEDVLRYLRSL